MGDLIWVGNTLLPRGVVFLAALIILLLVSLVVTGVIVGVITWLKS